MKVAILIPVLTKYDAVGNDACGMYKYFIEKGCEVRFFVNTSDHDGFPVSDYSSIKEFCNDGDSLVVYHFSTGWDGYKLTAGLPCKKIIKYHNITPAVYFEGICRDYERACTSGRAQIHDIASFEFDAFLPDSEFNGLELISAGVPPEKVHTLAPFHHIGDLENNKGDLDFLDRYSDDFVNVLMVGRLAPNKGYTHLVKAFADYYHNYNRKSRLMLVGKEDSRLAAYSSEVRRLISESGLDGSVYLLGGVSVSALKSAYLCADVFMILSEHEGFCVPLVEAMSMSIPVIAYGSSAIPRTVGTAGLVWDNLDPMYYSASLHLIGEHRDLRDSLGLTGRRRYLECFTAKAIEDRFTGILAEIGVDLG